MGFWDLVDKIFANSKYEAEKEAKRFRHIQYETEMRAKYPGIRHEAGYPSVFHEWYEIPGTNLMGYADMEDYFGNIWVLEKDKFPQSGDEVERQGE